MYKLVTEFKSSGSGGKLKASLAQLRGKENSQRNTKQCHLSKYNKNHKIQYDVVVSLKFQLKVKKKCTSVEILGID